MAADGTRQAQRLDAITGEVDRVLLALVIAIASLGVVMVASASIAVAEGLGYGPYHYLVRHVVYLGLGLVLAGVAMRTELKFVEQHAQLLLPLCALLLLAVFMPGVGHSVNGAQRWVSIGIGQFQMVEAVKLLFILWMASYLKRKRDEVQTDWGAVIKPMLAVGALAGLLLLQPDFGSTLLLLCIAFGMLLLGGAHLPKLFAPVPFGLAALALLAVAAPYRLRRLTSFQNPWEDPFNSGFQLTQALIAVGRGEFSGVGLGGSVQKLFYLPEAHTDFILAVIAEELGFLGVVGVVALFTLLAWRAFHIGLRAVEMRRLFAGYCAFGIGLWIGLQAFVSIGVNLGLLPTKGLTLPLVSAGGSSVLMTCAALGVLMRVSWEQTRAERQVAIARGADVAEADEDEPVRPAAPAPAAAERPAHSPLALAAAAAVGARRERIEPQLGAFP